jgi:purine-cytosine permease-like protein
LQVAKHIPVEQRPNAEGKTEYECVEVPESARKSYLSFFAIFAGRHTAGTEFTIGPLYIIHGASAGDVIFGLLVGNVLATLTWRFFCAPVAVKKRLTTYCFLDRICGSQVVMLYNLFTTLILSMIAGAMFSVSATAVGVLFDVRMPALHDWLPSSWAFSAIVLFVGCFTAVVAALGYDHVSRVSLVLVPYLFAVITYMGVESFGMFKIHSIAEFWDVASSEIWTSHAPEPGFSKFGFVHCVFSAWFCDLLLHIGMLDLTILRFGKSERVGWCSAVGMFPGHYFTWIVAGLLYALQIKSDPLDTAVKPGPMANAVAGANGLICVVVAGWSTANPVIYEAGLALQSILGSRWSSRQSTLLVGMLASLAGLFPAVVMRILELLAYGGLVIMPLGVVMFADCFILERLGLEFEAHARGFSTWPAIAAWVTTTAVCLPLALCGVLEVFFVPLPGVFLAGAVFLGSCWFRDRRGHKFDKVGVRDTQSNQVV